MRVGIAIVILRFDRAGNRTEKILRRGRQGEHAVALELAEADDGIGVVQIGRVGNVLCHARVRQVGLPLGKVPVERAARLLDGRKAAGAVDGVQMPRCVGAAWAVAHDDGRAAPDELLRQDPQQHRMGRCGPLRLHGRDEVRLDGDAHAGLYPRKAAERRKHLLQGCAAGLRLIIGVRGNGRIGPHAVHSSSSRRAARAGRLPVLRTRAAASPAARTAFRPRRRTPQRSPRRGDFFHPHPVRRFR